MTTFDNFCGFETSVLSFKFFYTTFSVVSDTSNPDVLSARECTLCRANLEDRSFELDNFDDCDDWQWQNGTERNDPADGYCPRGVRVVAVCHWCVLNQRQQQNELQRHHASPASMVLLSKCVILRFRSARMNGSHPPTTTKILTFIH